MIMARRAANGEEEKSSEEGGEEKGPEEEALVLTHVSIFARSRVEDCVIRAGGGHGGASAFAVLSRRPGSG